MRAKTPEMGPVILASGYLAKRTRTLGRWKKRWWQLSDDGTLLYFKNEDRTKALGEIDVARSCYDVKLGADQCKIEFPRAVSSFCCFSFSVLKRTYYLYSVTAADAKRWVESIANVSLVLNYRKKVTSHRPAPRPPHSRRPLSTPCIPATEAEDNVDGQYSQIEKRSYTMPSRLPRIHASLSGDITYLPAISEIEAADQHTELPKIGRKRKARRVVLQTLPTENRYGSAPSLQSGGNPTPYRSQTPRGGRSRHQAANARLWLDGSPAPNVRMGKARKNPRYNRKQGPRSVFEPTVRTLGMMPQSSSFGGSLDTLPTARPAPIHTGNRKMLTRWPVDMDGYELPPRPQSVDVSVLPRKTAQPSTQLQKRVSGVPILPTGQTLTTEEAVATAKSVPPPVKPKPILKNSRKVSSRNKGQQDSEGAAETPPEIPPKPFSLKVSVDSASGQRNVFLPPPPDFKPPPPPQERSSGGSSPVSMSAVGGTHDRVSSSSVVGSRTTKSSLDEDRSRSSGRQYNTSRYLQQVHNVTAIDLHIGSHTNAYKCML